MELKNDFGGSANRTPLTPPKENQAIRSDQKDQAKNNDHEDDGA